MPDPILESTKGHAPTFAAGAQRNDGDQVVMVGTRAHLGTALIEGKQVRGLAFQSPGDSTIRFVAFPIRFRGRVKIRSIQMNDFMVDPQGSPIGQIDVTGSVHHYLQLNGDELDWRGSAP